jgi:hypothetical protein
MADAVQLRGREELASAHRESGAGRHAEFCALLKVVDRADSRLGALRAKASRSAPGRDQSARDTSGIVVKFGAESTRVVMPQRYVTPTRCPWSMFAKCRR